MTREELLASVHALEPGDLLFIRIDRDDVRPEELEKLQQLVRAKVPAWADVVVATNAITLEQYRRVEP